MKHALALTISLLLVACAVTPLPPLPLTHPASAQAPEATVRTSSTNLKIDAATRTTQQLLSSSQPPSSDKGMSDPSSMPHMNH